MVIHGRKREISTEAEMSCDDFILIYVEKLEKLALLDSQKQCLWDCILHLQLLIMKAWNATAQLLMYYGSL